MTVGLGAAATVLTGGAILPVLGAVGVASGVGMAGYGTYKAATAKTDGEAKQALETLGMGVTTTVLSSAGAGKALESAQRAGVKSAKVAEDANILTKTAQMFKATPEALKMSGVNAKGNVMTWTTGTVHAHSNALQGANKYTSKPNDVEAYRFNPNGTTEEILANNPHVEQVNGKFGVVDKWATQGLQKEMANGLSEAQAIKELNLDASKVSGGKVFHFIDKDKNPMVMIYNEAEGDFAICDGNVFKGSYVDQAAYKASGAQNYQDPTKLTYGQRIKVTKQAPGEFKVMPEGTKVKTVSEGVQTVQKGQVVALDLKAILTLQRLQIS